MKTVKAQKAVEEPVVPPQDPAADAGADGSLIKKDQVIDLIQKARGVQSFTVKEVSGKGAIITVETLPAQPAILRSPEAQAAGRQQEVGQQPAEMAADAQGGRG